MYITKEWYPYFLAARRGIQLFEEEYAAKRIYEVIEEYGTLPVHAINVIAGFSSLFDRALIELQMKMYITMCGRQQKLSSKGEEYGWSSTVFCKTEVFFGESVFKQAAGITQDEASIDRANIQPESGCEEKNYSEIYQWLKLYGFSLILFSMILRKRQIVDV